MRTTASARSTSSSKKSVSSGDIKTECVSICFCDMFSRSGVRALVQVHYPLLMDSLRIVTSRHRRPPPSFCCTGGNELLRVTGQEESNHMTSRVRSPSSSHTPGPGRPSATMSQYNCPQCQTSCGAWVLYTRMSRKQEPGLQPETKREPKDGEYDVKANCVAMMMTVVTTTTPSAGPTW